MIDPRVRQLVRDNRKTRLHVLFVLWASTTPLLAKEIAYEIGCSADAVEDSVGPMEADGYISRIGAGRHPRWWVTDKARQLALPGLLLKNEGEKITLTSGSSSSSSKLEATHCVTSDQPLQLQSEGEKITLTSDDKRLIALFEEYGCPRQRAAAAVAVAIERGDSPNYIECQFQSWRLYVESPLGDGIKLPPAAFAAKKIEMGEFCAEFDHRRNTRDERRWNRWDNDNRQTLLRIDVLWEQIWREQDEEQPLSQGRRTTQDSWEQIVVERKSKKEVH